MIPVSAADLRDLIDEAYATRDPVAIQRLRDAVDDMQTTSEALAPDLAEVLPEAQDTLESLAAEAYADSLYSPFYEQNAEARGWLASVTRSGSGITEVPTTDSAGNPIDLSRQGGALGASSAIRPRQDGAWSGFLMRSRRTMNSAGKRAEYERVKRLNPEERYLELRKELATMLMARESGFQSSAEAERAAYFFGGEDAEGTPVAGFLDTDFRLGDARDQYGRTPWAGRAVRGDVPFRMTENSAQVRWQAGEKLGWLLEDLTPREARALMQGMDPDELERMQIMLASAGLYGEDGPALGQLSLADMSAIDALATQSALNPEKNVTELLTELTDQRLGGLMDRYGDSVLNRDADAPDDIVVSLSNRESLELLAEEIGLSEMGRRPNPDIVNRAISAVHERERKFARDQNRIERQSLGFDTKDELDLFLDALSAQESGGNYDALNPDSGARGRFQFMPETWAGWSRRVFGHVAEMSPENQNLVARAMASAYFDMFGNWRDVAKAWYAGPGSEAIGNDAKGYSPQGKYPTINKYADEVMSKFSQGRDFSYTTEQQDPTIHFLERPDAQAILNKELRAADEVGYQSWQFAEAAQNFYTLLGSVY